METNNTLNTYRTDNMHSNARLTPLGRAEIINELIQTGSTCRAVATARRVDEKTVRKWRKRSAEEPGAKLYDHSCVPIHQPRRTSPEREAQVVALRRHRLTYLRIAAATGLSKAAISRILKRHRLNRLSLLGPPPPVTRYEHDAPRDLLHLDIKSLVCLTNRAIEPPATGPSRLAEWVVKRCMCLRPLYIQILPSAASLYLRTTCRDSTCSAWFGSTLLGF